MSEAMEWQGDNLLLTLERDPETILVRLFPAKYTPRRLYVFEAAAYRSKELERENAELREQIDRWKRLAVEQEVVHVEHERASERENDELRELVRDYDSVLDAAVDVWGIMADVLGYGSKYDALHDRMRELGVEVDG